MHHMLLMLRQFNYNINSIPNLMVTADDFRLKGLGLDSSKGLIFSCIRVLDGSSRITSRVAQSRGLLLFVMIDTPPRHIV